MAVDFSLTSIMEIFRDYEERFYYDGDLSPVKKRSGSNETTSSGGLTLNLGCNPKKQSRKNDIKSICGEIMDAIKCKEYDFNRWLSLSPDGVDQFPEHNGDAFGIMILDLLMYEDAALFETALSLLFKYAFRTENVLQ